MPYDGDACIHGRARRDAAIAAFIATTPRPVAYGIRGVLPFAGGEEQTHSVESGAMHDRRGADIAQFNAYLGEEG